MNPIWAKEQVIGGQLVSEGNFTEVINYEVKTPAGLTKYCTGTFISSNTILTAAHCITDRASCELYKISGKDILISLSEDSKPLTVSSTLLNSDFLNPPTQKDGKCHREINPRYDIGIIILEEHTQNKTMEISTTFAISQIQNKKVQYRTIGFGDSIIESIENLTAKFFRGYLKNQNNTRKKQIGHLYLQVNNPMMPHTSERTKYVYNTSYKSTYHSQIAQIHPGDSGGPLINSKNQIVGVSSQYYLDEIKTSGDFPQVIGYEIESRFAPLHRSESVNLLRSAQLHGSTLNF